MKLFATKLITLLFCCFFLAGQINAQVFDVREEWRGGWFDNQLDMEYWNAPLGTINYPGISNPNPAGFPSPEEAANGGGSPGYYLNNPGCGASIAWATTQADGAPAGNFFVYSERNAGMRWNAVALLGGGPDRMAPKNTPFDVESTGGAAATELQGGGAVASAFYTHRIESTGNPRKALVMETAAEPVEVTHASSVNGHVQIGLTAAPSAGELVYVRYTTDAGGTFTNVLATASPGTSKCPGADCYETTIPNTGSTQFYVFTSTCVMADADAFPELCWLRHYGRDRRGTRELDGSGNGDCNLMENYRTRETINPICVAQGGEPIVFDGLRDAAYGRVMESAYAAPLDPTLTDADAADPSIMNSDFIGESAALVFYTGNDHNAPDYTNDLNSNCGGGTWANITNYSCPGGGTNYQGQADIHQFDVSWDNTYLYILVTGPNAYFEHDGQMRDEMDMFVAIDTDGDNVDADPHNTALSLPAAMAPFNKRVDFAGWTPSHFVAVARVNQAVAGGGTFAGLYSAGPAEIATDTDALAEAACPSFEVKGTYDGDPAASFTELRIPWSMIGGRPDEYAGQRMNFAVYTTYNDEGYDTYDTAPGYGQGHARPFEQIGDSPWDADHNGAHLDPVTGAADNNFYVFSRAGSTGYPESINADPFDSRVADQGPGDNNSGSSNGRQPGSDRTDNEFDTIEEYYWSISNIGQTNANIVCAVLPEMDDAAIACPDDFPAALTGTFAGLTAINASGFVTGGGSFTYTDGGACYDPNVTIAAMDVEDVTCTDPMGTCAGEVTQITRTYTITHSNHYEDGVAECSVPMPEPLESTCMITMTKTGTCIVPVELLTFNGTYSNEQVHLDWTTASELNNSHFEVERSLDAKTWTQLGKVEGAGTSVEVQRYDFVDEDYFKGLNYYRLKQVDFDGTYEYSPILSLNVNSGKDWSFFPNPVDDKLTIRTAIEGEFIISVYDSKGALAKSIVATVDGNGVELDLAVLSNGLYFVNVYSVDGKGVVSQQILKQ